MRFLVSVAEDWKVVVSGGGDPPFRHERALRRVEPAPGSAVPLPPADDLPPAGAPHHALCTGDGAAVLELLDRIRSRRPGEGEVEALGRYLFQTLLGTALWKSVRERSAGADLVELALGWSTADAHLHRLHWEMMHGPDGFLAGGGSGPVAITRVVPSGRPVGVAAGYPARVLFLVGSHVTDPKVQAGAEFMGLLRRVGVDGHGFHSRVVQNADAAAAARAVESFAPDVVHVIGHGDLDRHGTPFLEFQREPGDADPLGGRIFAEKLLHILTAEGRRPHPPPVVVLSACHSAGASLGRAMAGSDAAPLAAALVEGGVSVVVGMAGRISDRACRHFTRQFGEALVTGDPLVRAAELGRRAAFADAAEPARSVDWGFPAVFVADTVPIDHVAVPVPPEAVAAARALDARIAAYEPDRVPVFCGRQAFQEAYYRLMESSDRPVLAAYARREHTRVGVSRLLDEIVAQAVRDGHVPVLVRKTSPEEHLDFAGAAPLAVRILRSIGRASAAFELEPPVDARLLLLLRTVDPAAHDRIVADFGAISRATALAQLLRHYERQPPEAFEDLDPAAVRDALTADLRALAVAARGKHPHVAAAGGRALLLCDDVQEYDGGIDALFNGLLDSYGLGSADHVVPVVLGFKLGTGADSVLEGYTLHQQPKPWLEAKQLEPFREDGEDLLAYARVLLHPFEPVILPGVSDVPLAVSDRASDDVKELMEFAFRIYAGGRPTAFLEDRFYATARKGLEKEYLVRADDERLLREMLQEGGE